MCERCYEQQKKGFIICEACGNFLVSQKEFIFESGHYRPLFGSIKEVVSKISN